MPLFSLILRPGGLHGVHDSKIIQNDPIIGQHINNLDLFSSGVKVKLFDTSPFYRDKYQHTHANMQ